MSVVKISWLSLAWLDSGRVKRSLGTVLTVEDFSLSEIFDVLLRTVPQF